jgi:hypothetical protein
MPSTDNHSDGFRVCKKSVIADHTQVDEDMNDTNTDEDGTPKTIRAGATDVAAIAKAACLTQHKVYWCGQ